MRLHFQFFANYKPFRSYDNLPSVHKNIDILFLRETTEGFKVDGNLFKGYGEFMPTEEMAIGVCVDLGGTAGTREMGDAVASRVAAA